MYEVHGQGEIKHKLRASYKKQDEDGTVKCERCASVDMRMQLTW